jgi:zinc transporter
MKIHLLQGSRRTSGEQASTEWFDLDGTSQEDLDWLERDANLDRSSAKLLLNALPHSRCVHTDAGTLITLVRPDGVKGDGHQDLEVWLEPERVITICRGAESVVADVAARVDEGSERGDCMSLLATLTESLVRPLENDIAELAEEVDDLEDEVLDSDGPELLNAVADARRRALAVRRRLNSMRDILSTLTFKPELFPRDLGLDSLRGAADYLGHLVSQVDATRDRLILLFDQLSAREQHRINKAMQKLAVVGTVFLPLTFITGLLGINVAGIPDAHDPMAFWLVCLFLVTIVIAAIMIIKWKNWI